MKKKGISLIVLCITVLVMSILAATVIIALEDTGIIKRSKNTVANQNYVQEYERLQVVKNGILTDNLGEITIADYVNELRTKGIIESGETSNIDGSVTVITKTGFALNIMQTGDDLTLSLGEQNATLSLSATTLSGDIATGNVTKTVTVITTNVNMGDVVWTTSDSSVAIVIPTATGANITMVGKGTATIVATYGAAKQTLTVTVTKPDPTLSLNKTTASFVIKSGSTKTDTLTATATNTANAIAWTSSNTSVATVSGSGKNGVVTIKGAGTAVITASVEGISKSCTYTVTTDNTAPTFIMNAEDEGGNGYAYIYVSSISTTTKDYPLTIKYYYKSGSSSSYTLGHTLTLTSGTSYGYSFYTGIYGSEYDVKVEVIDAAGNVASTIRTIFPYACFVAGTQVLTENGIKNIEDVKLGEKVYTVNLDNNKKELKEVTDLIINYTKELYELTIGSETVLATPNHRFYIQDKGWIRAKDLEIGDEIVAKGTTEDMTVHSIAYRTYTEEIPVYNLTVDGHHNYLITKYELLVHNASSPV